MAKGSSDGCGRRPNSNNGQRKRKTELKKMEDKNSRVVTFTKRRGTLFRKATDLSVTCGAEVAIITYSPNGNPFVFSSSSADAVLRRFVGPAGGVVGDSSSVMPSSREHWLTEFRQWERGALLRLDKAQKQVQEAGSDGKSQQWWEEDPAENAEEEELELYVECLEKLHEKVRQRAEEITRKNKEETAMAGAGAPTTSVVVPCDGNVVDPLAMAEFDASIGKEGEEVIMEDRGGDGSLLDYEYDFGYMPLFS